ncbi:hypothetical protein ElyMa_002448400 [Elysia marginata]|uniref:Uncharacterized protein n=1 Tax=Elysia marginata TaxID=1093978 RepID=A0AAV4GJ34_9GAST|nr:hypothetical protein ElyMa_002448400 [Elysia marginata]
MLYLVVVVVVVVIYVVVVIVGLEVVVVLVVVVVVVVVVHVVVVVVVVVVGVVVVLVIVGWVRPRPPLPALGNSTIRWAGSTLFQAKPFNDRSTQETGATPFNSSTDGSSELKTTQADNVNVHKKAQEKVDVQKQAGNLSEKSQEEVDFQKQAENLSEKSQEKVDARKHTEKIVVPVAATGGKRPADPGPKRAYVTYNDSVVIQCLDSSPYVFCSGRPPARSKTDQAADAARHPPWKFSLARELGWTPPVDFSSCPYNNCVDVGAHAQADTDAVAFNGVGLSDGYSGPHRSAGSSQTWLFMAWESPTHTRASFLSSKLPEFRINIL